MMYKRQSEVTQLLRTHHSDKGTVNNVITAVVVVSGFLSRTNKSSQPQTDTLVILCKGLVHLKSGVMHMYSEPNQGGQWLISLTHMCPEKLSDLHTLNIDECEVKDLYSSHPTGQKTWYMPRNAALCVTISFLPNRHISIAADFENSYPVASKKLSKTVPLTIYNNNNIGDVYKVSCL